MTKTYHVWKTYQVVPLLAAMFCIGAMVGFVAAIVLVAP